MTATKKKILIIDDHPIFVEGLTFLLSRESDLEVVGQAFDGVKGVELCVELQPDVVIMDITLPGMNGIEATREILSKNQYPKIIALSASDDRKAVTEMLAAGACGYLRKDIAYKELVAAIHSVLEGKSYLSPPVAGVIIQEYLGRGSLKEQLTAREIEVVKLIAEGKSTKEIAYQLDLSVKTVETHKKHIMEKLNCRSIADLVKYAIKEGLVNL